MKSQQSTKSAGGLSMASAVIRLTVRLPKGRFNSAVGSPSPGIQTKVNLHFDAARRSLAAAGLEPARGVSPKGF
jgi:hypothetical protein